MNKNLKNVIVYKIDMSKNKLIIFSEILFLILYVVFLYNAFYYHKENVKNLYKDLYSEKDKILQIYNSNIGIDYNELNNENFLKNKGNIEYDIKFEFYDIKFVRDNYKNIGLNKDLKKDNKNNINSERYLFLKRNYNKYNKILTDEDIEIIYKFSSDGKTIFNSVFKNTILVYSALSIILLLFIHYIYLNIPISKINSFFRKINNTKSHFLNKIYEIKNLYSSGLSYENKLNLSALIIFIGFISSFFYYYIIESLIYPPSPDIFTPFHNIINVFCDYYSIDNYFHINGFDSSQNNYFPGSLLIIQILKTFTFSNPYVGVKIILLLYIFFLLFFISYYLKNIDFIQKTIYLLIITFLSYPFLFTLHTANFEGFVFIGLALSFIFYFKRKFFITGFFVGFATSIKIYPLIFVLVYARKTNIKNLLLGMSVGFGMMFIMPFILSIFVFPFGNFTDNLFQWINTFPEGLKFYKNHMVLGWSGVHFGHSVLNSLWLILGPGFDFSNYFDVFIYIFGTALTLSVLKLLKMNLTINKFIFCLCFLCLFTPTSTDYKLLHFLIPLMYLIRSTNKNSDFIKLLILISLLMVSKSYFYFYDNIYANTNTLLNTLILFYIGLLSLKIDKLNGIKSLRNAIKKFI